MSTLTTENIIENMNNGFYNETFQRLLSLKSLCDFKDFQSISVHEIKEQKIKINQDRDNKNNIKRNFIKDMVQVIVLEETINNKPLTALQARKILVKTLSENEDWEIIGLRNAITKNCRWFEQMKVLFD